MNLHAAAAAGDVGLIKQLLSTRPDSINKRNENWETALYCACAADHRDAAKVLIKAGARVNAKAKKRFTSLHAAARFGHMDVLEELVDANAGLDRETIRNMTPLLVAIRYGQESCAEYLLSRGSDVNARDMFGRTVLHWTIKMDQRHLFELLLSHDVDLSATDKFNKTPIMQAVKSNRPELLRRLLDSKGDSTTSDKLRRTPMHVAALKGHCNCLELLLQSGFSPDIWNDSIQSKTPLMTAAFSAQLEAIKVLLNSGADPNVTDCYGLTALCFTITGRSADFNSSSKPFSMAALDLIRANTDVNMLSNWPSSWKDDSDPWQNAVEMAFRGGYSDLTKMLARAGCHPRNLFNLFRMKTKDLPEHARTTLDLLDWLRWFYRSPRSLKELSRTSVLRSIPAKFFARNLEALDLAPGLRNYLSFLDIEDLVGTSESRGMSKESIDSESDTEEEMEPSVFDSDLYGDHEPIDTDEEPSKTSSK